MDNECEMKLAKLKFHKIVQLFIIEKLVKLTVWNSMLANEHCHKLGVEHKVRYL